MKALLFIAYVPAIILASMRWEWVMWTSATLFATAAIFGIFMSFYRHLRASRLL